MNEGLNVTKKEGHLKEGIKPIMTSIGSPKDFPEGIDKHLESQGLRLEEIRDVNWFDRNEGKKPAEIKTYIMSSVDSSSKFSKDFFICIGLLVAGITPTGEKLSFLTHQPPSSVLHFGWRKDREDFDADLKIRLLEIKEKCVPGTIDAVIVGGEAKGDVSPRSEYEDTIKKLGQIVQENLGFEPVVINGPKTFDAADEVYYDNENRRLYFLREYASNINPNTQSFIPSDIDKQKK